MQTAVNFSPVAADLARRGHLAVDVFKCPAWPDLVDTVRRQHPVYVHFPLSVGAGIRDATDSETRQPADWRKMEALLETTRTPLVNVHLAPTPDQCPDIPVETRDPVLVDRVATRLIEDLQAVIGRFGVDRVIAENIYDHNQKHLHAAFFPEVIARVLEETGAGLLLDISHARLAARGLGLEAWDYLQQLPLTRIREIHVSGVQHFGAAQFERLAQAGLDPAPLQKFAGRLIDHLPMTPDDWSLLRRVMSRIQAGLWGKPWVVTLEYGGVGTHWETLTDAEVLARDVRELDCLVNPQSAARAAHLAE